MRIAQIAPLYESVPPKLYGGTERVVSYLTEELVRQGHEVTLFASGDSITQAKLLPGAVRSLRTDNHCIDQIAHHFFMLEQLYRAHDEFDIIHSHIDYFPFSLFRRISTPAVTTLHGRMDLWDLKALYHEFDDMPVVSISHSQRKPLPNVNWAGNVYHGLPKNMFSFGKGSGKYLAFLGRICPEKRVDLAIEIAKQVGIPLKIAAKVDKVDRAYYTNLIEPLLDDPLIEFIGEIGEKEKGEFLGDALALLFPIDWPEPFGMVLIEAWACGTPVITTPRGSVPELITPGVTGYICHDIQSAVAAVKLVEKLDRKAIRAHFEKNFTAPLMARNYLKLYSSLIESRKKVKTDVKIFSPQ